jgi:hypothetical protein
MITNCRRIASDLGDAYRKFIVNLEFFENSLNFLITLLNQDFEKHIKIEINKTSILITVCTIKV